MVASFRDLKNSRDAMFDKLNSAIDQQKGGRPAKDPRYWEPTLDKSGNGYAVIRFLPAPGEEVLPYALMYSYGFRGPKGQWYIEMSPQTIGLPDPVQERWQELWNADQKEAAKRFKRSTSYVSNILVVNDPANPENNGKVFLYRYGPKIFERIELKMRPQFEHEQRVNPFDMWEGCNLELRIITKDRSAANPNGFRNYDNSAWQSVSAIAASDEEIEKIWLQEYSLAELIAPDKFESYDALKKKFDAVMGYGDQPPMQQAAADSYSPPAFDPAMTRKPTVSAPPVEQGAVNELPWESTTADNTAANAAPVEAADAEEDPEIAEYRRLAGLG